ncbi:MAG: O-antigen ligase family protein [Candidatus Komeilibacteria bacterium]
MRNYLVAWFQTLTWEKVLVFSAQWLTAGCFLLFLTFSTDFLFSFSFLRNIIFRIITTLLCLIYVSLFSLNRSYRPRFNSSKLVLLALFLVYCLSAVLNNTLLSSFWGNYLRMDGLFTWATYIIFALVVSRLFRNLTEWQKVFQIIFFVSSLTALVAVSQYLHHPLLIDTAGGSRASSTFGNVSYYGFWQALTFFLGLYLAFNSRLRQMTVLLWLFALTDVILIIGEVCAYGQAQSGPLWPVLGNLYLLLLWFWPQFWLLRYRLDKKSWQRWLAVGSLLLLQLAALWLSGARIAVVATAFGLVVLFIIAAWQQSRRLVSVKQRLILAIILLACLGLGLIFVNWQSLTLSKDDLQPYNSFYDRLVVWDISWQAFRAKPILGWGPENFSLAFNQHYDDRIFRSGVSPIWYDKAHNIFIQHLVEGGLVALLLYLVLWLLLLRSWLRLWRQKPAERTAWVILAAGALVYQIQSIFYFDTINNQLIFFVLLAYIWSRETELSDKVDKYGLPLQTPFRRPVFFSVLCLIAALFIYNFFVQNLLANYRFTTSLMSVRSDWQLITAEKLESIRYDAAAAPTLGKSELRYQYVLLVSDLIARGSPLEVAALKQQIAYAESVMLKNISKKPGDTVNYVELANFYLLAGRIDSVYWERGLKLAEILLRDNPERTQFLYIAGQLRLASGQEQAGLDLFQQVAERRPEIFDTHIQYYKQLLNLGWLKEANDYFNQHLVTAPYADLLAVTQYDLRTSSYDLAAKHLEILKQRQKSPADVALLTALLLLGQGKTEKAEISAQQAVNNYPSLLPALIPYFPSLQP